MSTPVLPSTKERTEFVQLYRSSMKALRQLALEAPTAHAVLYVLMERINNRNALIASHATLAKLTGKSRATITRALSELKNRNYIEVVRAGNVSVIVVNKRVVWTTDTVLRQRLAIFDAQVIVSADEQLEPDRLGKESDLIKLPPVLVPPEVASLVDDSPEGQAELSF